MKKEGLSFMEAVEQIRKGNDCVRDDSDLIMYWKYDSICFTDKTQEKDLDSSVTRLDLDSNWELVDKDKDKDWVLSNQTYNEVILTLDKENNERQIKKILNNINEDVKQCRDLILEDIRKEWKGGVGFGVKYLDIVKKRFGNLK